MNPELGEFRVHAALLRLGIELSPHTCGRILALNRKLYSLPGPSKQPHEPREMPFEAVRRHQYWTVDLRYLDHQLGDGNVSQYKVTYERDQKGLKTITEPRLFETQFQSPQLLWELGPEDWHLVVRLPEYAPQRRTIAAAVQLPLLPEAAIPTG